MTSFRPNKAYGPELQENRWNLRSNIYLTGFMGSGKSTVGKLLAHLLGYRFFDSDREVETVCGMPLAQILSTPGAASLRSIQRHFLLHGHPENGCIIACGGGLSAQHDIISFLNSKGMVFYLFASSDTIYTRLKAHPKRPLWKSEDPLTRIRSLLAQQMPISCDSRNRICTEGYTPNEVAARIRRTYQGRHQSLG